MSLQQPPPLDYATRQPRWHHRKQVRRWIVGGFGLAGILILVALAPRLFHRSLSPFEQMLNQKGHGYLYEYHGRQTRYVSNSAFDAVVASNDPQMTPKLVEALQSGRLDTGQFCVMDIALWRRVTGLPRESLAVLGSYQRTVGADDYHAVAASWAAWLKAGQPIVKTDGTAIPDLRGYPKLDHVIQATGQ